MLVRTDWAEDCVTKFGHRINPVTALTYWFDFLNKLVQGGYELESWEDWAPLFLGTPHGDDASIFVDRDTVESMKRIFDVVIDEYFLRL